VYEKWFNTVFVPEVRARTRSPVILIVDNCGAYTELECDGVKICPLPPNVTSVHQSLDAGIIACLKRRYKKRLISLVLRAFPEKRRRQEAEAASAASTAATATAAEAALAARTPSGPEASTPAPSLPARGCGEAGQGAPAGGVVASSAVGAGVVGGAGPIGATGAPGPPAVLVSQQLGAGSTAVAVRGGPLVRLAVPNIGASAASSCVRSPMPPGTVFGNGATMDWTPLSAARASLAAGVGFSGTSFGASSATRISQSGVPPGTPPLVDRPSVPRNPATTMTPVPPPTPVPAAQGAALVSTVPCTAPDYRPPAVVGFPGSTAADLALAARPNVWVEQQRFPPSTPSGPARRCSRRPRRQAAPTRPDLGVRDGAATHLQDVAEIVREEWDAVTPATIAHCWAKACILPLSMEARVIAEHGEYRTSSRPVYDDVREILGMMGTCTVAQECFGEGDVAEKELVVEGWLGLEEDMHAIEDTVDAECAKERTSECNDEDE